MDATRVGVLPNRNPSTPRQARGSGGDQHSFLSSGELPREVTTNANARAPIRAGRRQIRDMRILRAHASPRPACCCPARPWTALTQQQFCAIDGQPLAAPPPATAAVQALPVNNSDRNVYPVIWPEEIAHSPALTRIASKGATLLDLGVDDGIRTVFAYLGNQWRCSRSTRPSGAYAVRSGRLWTWPSLSAARKPTP